MKKGFLVIAFGLLLMFISLSAGCDVVTGSGETTTWEMDYSDFKKLDIGSGFIVDVTWANNFRVSITTDKSLTEYLSIEQRGDALYIGLKSGYTYADAERKAVVTLPDLRGLELSGGSTGRIRGFTTAHAVSSELSG